MHPKAQEAILEKIVAIAGRATDAGRPPVGGRSWQLPGVTNTTIDGASAIEFRKIVENLAVKHVWSERFSERYIDDRLGKVLVAAHRRGRAEAATTLDELVRKKENFATEQIVLVPIAGLTLMVPELNVGQVTIRRGPPAGISIEGEAGEYPTDKVYAEFKTVAEPIRAGERGTEETRRALEAITFAHVARDPFGHMSDGFASLESEKASPATWFGAVSGGGVFTDYRRTQQSWPVWVSSGTLIELNAHGLAVLSELLSRQPNDLSDFEDALLRAVHWFAASQAQIEIENKLLNLTICLEALVGPIDHKTDPISGTMAEAVALIIGHGYQERSEIRKSVIAQYRVRSKVSHGSKSSVLESEVRQFRDIVVKLITRMLALRVAIKHRQELFAWIERTKLGGPLASPGTARTIGEIRAERGLSFMELVHRLGCQPDELDHWERVGADLSALRRLADALEFPIERIALPANKVLLNHRGHGFLLAARRQGDGRWVARTEGWDPTDADDWPCRAVDPAHPHADSPAMIVTANCTFAADSPNAALDGLGRRINGAMERALTRTRLPDEPEDWQPPEIPQHWIDHLAVKARREARRSRY